MEKKIEAIKYFCFIYFFFPIIIILLVIFMYANTSNVFFK